MYDTDAELMRRAKAGDASAFAQLVRRYESALRHVALARLGVRESAEDVVQEVLWAAFRSRHTYDERFGFRTWLWTILLNRCRYHAQRQARAPKTVSLDAAPAGQSDDAATAVRDEPCGGAASPLTDLLRRERRELLEQLLARLTAAQADALRLRFFGELTFPEMAAVLECSPGAAKERVRSGLLRLARWLESDAAVSVPSGATHPRAAPSTDVSGDEVP